METLFDLTNPKDKFIHQIDPKIIIHIDHFSYFLGILYFTDEMNHKINIPDGISIYSYNIENEKTKVMHNIAKQEYPLCWYESYEVKWYKNILLTIKNERKWKITSKLV
jgi:hypothetical protein